LLLLSLVLLEFCLFQVCRTYQCRTLTQPHGLTDKPAVKRNGTTTAGMEINILGTPDQVADEPSLSSNGDDRKAGRAFAPDLRRWLAGQGLRPLAAQAALHLKTQRQCLDHHGPVQRFP
jgi:hypothetical protein